MRKIDQSFYLRKKSYIITIFFCLLCMFTANAQEDTTTIISDEVIQEMDTSFQEEFSGAQAEEDFDPDKMTFGGDVDEYQDDVVQNSDEKEDAIISEVVETTDSKREKIFIWIIFAIPLVLFVLDLFLRYTSMIGRWYLLLTTVLMLCVNIFILLYFTTSYHDTLGALMEAHILPFGIFLFILYGIIAFRGISATIYNHGYYIETGCDRDISPSFTVRPIVYFTVAIFVLFLFSNKIKIERSPSFQSFLIDAIQYQYGWSEFLMAVVYYAFFVYQFGMIIYYAVMLKQNTLKLVEYILVLTFSCCLYFYILIPLMIESFFLIAIALAFIVMIKGAAESSKWDSESVHSHDIYQKDEYGNSEKVGTGYTHKSKLSGGNVPNRPDKDYHD